MRRFLLSGPAKLWAGIGVFGTCLGIWSDAESVPDVSNTVVPIIVWLIPHVAFWGMIASGVYLAIAAWVWGTHIWHYKARRFRALTRELQDCRFFLQQHHDKPSELGAFLGRFNLLNVKIDVVLGQLRDLGIKTPPYYPVDNRAYVQYIIGYLSAVEGLARQGWLKQARKMNSQWENVSEAIEAFDG